MKLDHAVSAFGALSQQTRLKTLRFLVRKAPDPVPAGDIALAMNVPQNTMSSHLSILVNAGLLQSTRSGRSILYSVDLDGLGALVTYLVADCCQGQPENCSAIVNSIVPKHELTEV